MQCRRSATAYLRRLASVLRRLTAMAIMVACGVNGAEPARFILAVTAPGTQPYNYLDPLQQTYIGVVPDILNSMQQLGLLNVSFVDSSKARSEQWVIDGQVDAMLSSASWVSEPDKVIFSAPVLSHSTYLYSTAPFAADFRLTSLQNKRVCVRENYTYPGLQSYITANQLILVYASSLSAIAPLLVNGRCDYAALDNFSAQRFFSAPSMCRFNIYQSPEPTLSVDVVLVMRPALAGVKALIDRHIQAYAQSGELAASVQRHAPSPEFPKLARCPGALIAR